LKKITLVLTIILTIILTTAGPSLAAAKTWNDVVVEIDKEIHKAVETYKKGEVEGAKGFVNEAYFGPYEGQQMEKTVRMTISAKANAQIEGEFRDIKQAMTDKKDPREIEDLVQILMKDLHNVADQLDGVEKSGFGIFLSSLLIIVREGFEAILILGAIIAYLVKTGNKDKVKTIYQGVGLAILASFATAIGIKMLFDVSGASQEILEGTTMLIAVAVLFSMSFWLVSKVEAKKWQNYIEGKVQASLGKGSTYALVFAAFLAVYREGAETVLFYLAMYSGAEASETQMITLGMVVGAVALVGIFIVVRYGSVKIPLKPFFIGTSILMYYLAFVFAGNGINELQAGNAVGITNINIPAVEFMGIYPTLETVSLQGLLILAAVGGLLYQKFSKAKTGVESSSIKTNN
jgi:high-affinity iron transporter